jgi:hypothetical protein
MTPLTAAPAIWTVGSAVTEDCVAVSSSPEMSRPQPESRTTAGNISSPCFVSFLPQYDIISHQLFDEFERILQRQFSVICGAVPDFPARFRQEIGGYGGIHVVMEDYRPEPGLRNIRHCFKVFLRIAFKFWLSAMNNKRSARLQI